MKHTATAGDILLNWRWTDSHNSTCVKLDVELKLQPNSIQRSTDWAPQRSQLNTWSCNQTETN